LSEQQEGKKDERPESEVLEEARKRYRLCAESMTDNITDARNDLEFLKGGRNQWDDDTATAREAARLPMITVNTLPAFLHQVTNDQRMNTPMIKVHPVDDNSDIETAKVFQGLIKHIEYDSNADVAEDTAVNCAAAVGFGYFRLITDYEAEDSFDQCLKYGRIRNPLSVKIDPMSVEADGSDMKFCFIESLMSKDEFSLEYPKADASNTNVFNDNTDGVMPAWVSADTVMVCEYYSIESEPDELVELSNGDVWFKSKLPQKLPDGITLTDRKRPTTISKVIWRKITAANVLETTEIKCKWIPVFPVYGDEIDIDGKVTRSGIIRNAKGPAQMYNVCMTGATEEVMLRAKTPYIMAEGQEEGHEQEWQAANRAPLSFITYKPTSLDGKLNPPPQRNPMADVPTGMLSLAMQSKENIMSTTGLFQASLGQKGTATSGKQEIAQQREGDVANYHYQDGLLRSLRQCGRCLVDMIPHYYNSRRTVRILGEDDSAEHVVINDPQQVKQDQGGIMVAVEKVMHDMTAGKYDVTVSSGPSFTTMRQESAEFFASAMQAAKDPATASVISYLAIKNQDVPHADLAAKLIKSTLPPAMQQIIEDETGGEDENGQPKEPMVQTPNGPVPMSQIPQVIEQMGMALQNADQAVEQADVMDKQNKAKELEIKARDSETKAFEAETKRLAEQAAAQAEQERIEIERIKAETLRLAQAEKTITAESAAEKERQAPPATVDEIAQIVSASRPIPPSAMTIKAPSGAAYEVTIQ
jgi:hypothetical protein